MADFDTLSVINRIEELKNSYGWTTYRLAKESGISYTALLKTLTTPHIPNITTLYKICVGFGISLTEFFSYCENPERSQNTEIKNLLRLWTKLDNTSKRYATIYMKGLAKTPIEDDENI